MNAPILCPKLTRTKRRLIARLGVGWAETRLRNVFTGDNSATVAVLKVLLRLAIALPNLEFSARARDVSERLKLHLSTRFFLSSTKKAVSLVISLKKGILYGQLLLRVIGCLTVGMPTHQSIIHIQATG